MPSKKPNRDSGFTLIEILLSISIISVMVTVAFASFGAARDRANDGTVKEQLGIMRIVAERSYQINRGSDKACLDVATTSNDLTAKLPSGTSFTCLDGSGGYALQASLSDGSFYCTDAFGRSNESQSTMISQSGTCGGSTDCDCR